MSTPETQAELEEAKRHLFWRSVNDGFRESFSTSVSLPKVAAEYLVSFGTIFVLLMLGLPAVATDEIDVFLATIIAALIGLPVLGAIHWLAAMASAHDRLATLGRWQEAEFIYRNPLPVMERRISADDDGTAFTIVLPFVPANAFVRYRIETEPQNEFWNLQFGAFHMVLGPGWGVGRTGGCRIGPNSEASLFAQTRHSAVASVLVRVLVVSWSVGKVAE